MPSSLAPFGERGVGRRVIKPLKWLVADLLASHIDEVFDGAGASLRHLPVDVKCALMAVARRKGCLDDAILAALMDESATSLDVAGCKGVTDAGVQALASNGQLAQITAADLSGCMNVTAVGLRALAAAAPRLHTLRCGGNAVCNKAVRVSLNSSTDSGGGGGGGTGGILPSLLANGKIILDSWEELAIAEKDTRGTGTRAAREHTRNEDEDEAGYDADSLWCGGGARSLRWLVWPNVDGTTRVKIVTQCPRVRIVAGPALIHFSAQPEHLLRDEVVPVTKHHNECPG